VGYVARMGRREIRNGLWLEGLKESLSKDLSVRPDVLNSAT
jgi:hypothetical protein